MAGVQDAGFILYRCRNCGRVTKGLYYDSVYRGLREALNREAGWESEFCSTMENVHVCHNGQIGVQDIIGALPDAKESPR